MERVDWSALVEEAVLPFEPVFFERGLTLTARIQPGLAVWGRPDQLRQAVDVLLDNAQKYALSPSTVYLHLDRTRHDRCLLMVENRADPLSPQEAGGYFQAILPHGQGPQPGRQLRPGPAHRPADRRGPPGPHLGGEPGGPGAVLYRAAPGLMRERRTAGAPVSFQFVHGFVQVPFSARCYSVGRLEAAHGFGSKQGCCPPGAFSRSGRQTIPSRVGVFIDPGPGTAVLSLARAVFRMFTFAPPFFQHRFSVGRYNRPNPIGRRNLP